MAATQRKLRTFQFGLRTLLIVILVICTAGAWLRNTYQFVQERKAFWPEFDDPTFSVHKRGYRPPDAKGISWVRRQMGDVEYPTLIYDSEQDVDGGQLEAAKRLFPEAKIWGWRYGDDPLPEGVELINASWLVP